MTQIEKAVGYGGLISVWSFGKSLPTGLQARRWQGLNQLLPSLKHKPDTTAYSRAWVASHVGWGREAFWLEDRESPQEGESALYKVAVSREQVIRVTNRPWGRDFLLGSPSTLPLKPSQWNSLRPGH